MWGFIDVLISIAEQGFCGWHPPAGLEHLASFIINSLAARNYVKYAFDQLVNIGKAFSAGAAGEEEKATQYFIGDSLVAGAFAIMAGMADAGGNQRGAGPLSQQGGAHISRQKVMRIAVDRPFRKNANGAARR